MFLFTNFFTVLIPFWGMLGLWTTRIGYHHTVSSKVLNVFGIPITDQSQWEFYFYNVIFGLFQAPYYAVRALGSCMLHLANRVMYSMRKQ
jgi:hypothetical protein